MKKLILLILCVGVGLISACSNPKRSATILVGTIAGPETQLMETAEKVAERQYGLKIQIVSFSDYNVPNQALNAGSIDANAFQHLPYLQMQIKNHGYKLTPIGKTFIYPMGLYSKKIKQLNQVPDQGLVGIPNDPSNEARALLLLQQAGLIHLREGTDVNATPLDINTNPKHLKIIELDAAELPRALRNLTLAAINTNYATAAKLSPQKDALFIENANSPYANLIVVRTADKDNPQLRALVHAYQSPAVIAKAKVLFGDGAIPAWNTQKK
jgi:D-methionine transport system substrate-binding protein